MKKIHLNKILAASLALAALAASPVLRADTVVTFVGGNASSSVLYDRATNILTGLTVSNVSSLVQSYIGTIPGQPGLGNVTIHFVLSGAIGGLQSVNDQTPVTTATGASLVPQVAVSSTAPEAVAIDPSSFTQTKTLVVPYAYIKNPAGVAPDVAGVTNLTQRQAYLLESAAGTVPTSFFGGNSANPIYFVGRNTASAVRTEIDLNIYYSGTIASYVTNALGQPIPDPNTSNPGQSGGAAIRTLLSAIPNAIGTVAVQDIKTFTPLAYEGVSFSVTNVENGSYPLWGYEKWLYKKTGQNGTPSANQLAVINTLLGAVTNGTYQATSPVFVGNYVPLSGLQVYRNSDGGQIYPN